VKLLLDQNLSPRLIELLSDVYPGSEHVSRIDLEKANDTEVWKYARQNGFTIVSKDADFSELSMAQGSPPKVIWIRRGNCPTQEIENILRRSYSQVEDLQKNKIISILVLF
jgi:predicted nuclease of predicted toxin-antitoxin system